MQYALSLFIGFIAAAVGVVPPGLLNMTAVKVSINEGKTRALVFAAGATLVLTFQGYIALLFARFLDSHPQVILVLRITGLVIFAALTVYFFFFAKPAIPKKKELKFHSKRNRFFVGMALSALNFFPIPFYVVVSLTLSSYHIFSFETMYILIFVLGIILGTFFGFYCFITFFQKMEDRTTFIIRNMNYIIGSVTALICAATLINVFEYYYG
jgi:threonine/homoserine/homoserine lactone efflux protein